MEWQKMWARANNYPKLKDDYDRMKANYEVANAERQKLERAVSEAQRSISAYQALCKKFMPTNITPEVIEEMYFAIAPTCDSEGFHLFRAAEEILGKFDYGHFYYEDSRGYFEEMSGYEMLGYLEADHASELGDKTNNRWEIVPGTTCEKWVNLTVDHTTKEYREYLDKLYKIALHKMGILDITK